MDDLDRIGRHATAALLDDVQRRVDQPHVEAALRRARAGEPATVVELTTPSRRTRWWLPAVAVAAVAAVVAAVVVIRDDPPRRVGPAVTEPSVASTTVPSTTAPNETTSTMPQLEPVQTATVTLDDSTPVLEGAIVATLPIADTHPWDAAVLPSGRVFVGQGVDGATYSELVDGQLVDTDIPFVGDLAAGLDDRLYNRAWADSSLTVWTEGADGTWAITETTGADPDCWFVVQPDSVNCGNFGVHVDPAVDASYVSWSDDMQVSVGLMGDAIRTWQIELDSDAVSLDQCQDRSCTVGWRAGRDGYVWTPDLGLDLVAGARFVSLLRPDSAPATAWLHCGNDCLVIGSTADSLFTLGYAEQGAGDPAIVVRRFAFDDIGALRSAVDPAADALAGFAAPPEHTPDLADVPTMLPVTMSTNVDAVRSEGADGPVTMHNYEQLWARGGDDPVVLRVSTALQQGPSYDGDSVEVAPWDRSLFAPMAPGFAQLVLTDPSGMVVLWAIGITRDDLVEIARSLRLRTGAAGWDADVPDGFVPLSEGWGIGSASRSVRWADVAELSIVHGVPMGDLLPVFAGDSIEVVDVNGARGVVAVTPLPDTDRVAVVWSPQPDLVVRFGWMGDADQALEVARSIAPVDQATWEATTVVDTSGDGCNSMFC